MARNGITKQMVQKAKTSLMAQGKYPSIKAVRTELGNTGSKTTISRYLKELEVPPKDALNRLSEPLVKLIHDLSEQLKDEAEEKLTKAQAQFLLEKNQYLLKLYKMQATLENYQHRIKNLETELKIEQKRRLEDLAKNSQIPQK